MGLGNPGKRYEKSRHNVGFRVVDRFARDEGFEGERRKFNAVYVEKRLELGEGPVRVLLVKPLTYMNLSGNAVRDLLGFYGTALDEDLNDALLVVYDDLDLPEGRMRFRARGSSGGHRGIGSVISALGHDRFSRLKVGIGRREGADAKDFVLEPVRGESREFFDRSCERAAGTLRVWLEEGIRVCMNRFNAREAATPETEESG